MIRPSLKRLAVSLLTTSGIAAMLLATFVCATGSPAFGDTPPTDTCGILRAVGITQVAGPYKTEGFETEHCFGTGLPSKFEGFIIRSFTDPGSADSEGIGAFKNANSHWQTSSGYGEQTIACPSGSDCLAPGTDGAIAFRRGCYTAVGTWVAADEGLVRDKLSKLDALLKTIPCPGSAPTSAPAPAAGSLGLACDQSSVQSDGSIACHAAVSGGSASYTYSWTLDGVAQSQSGADFSASNLAPGPHTVSVTARDSQTNAALAPQNVSFTRNAAGAPSGGANPLLIAGGALAVLLAVGGLIGARLRRGPRVSVPPAKPDSIPEDPTRHDDRPKEPPRIVATLVVSPSVRSQASGLTASIWGDTADFVYVGYHLDVSSGWSIVPGSEQFDFKLDKGTWQRVEQFDWFRYYPEAVPTEEHRAIVQAPWCDKPDSLTIKVAVNAVLTDGQGTSQLCTSGPDDPSTQQTIAIVGAGATLQFICDPTAPADGTTQLRIAPALMLFGEPYAGGLWIVPSSETFRTTAPASLNLDTYFEKSYESFSGDPQPARRVQGLLLRCKFHLNDDDMKALTDGHCIVGFKAVPSGHGPGEDTITSSLDSMAAAHYQACGAHVTSQNIADDSNGADFVLQPSIIELTFNGKTDAPKLPDVTVAADQRYAITVRGQVWSAGRQHVVRGSDIKRDRPSGSGGVIASVKNWSIDFKFDPPSKGKMAEWDPTAHHSPPGGIKSFDVADVNEDGWLTWLPGDATAGDETALSYDHWALYYNRATSNDFYLAGQCSYLIVELDADGGSFGRVQTFIGPPCKLYAYADMGGIIGHVSIGIIDEAGRELRVGFFPSISFMGMDRQTGAAIGTPVGGVVGAGAGALAGDVIGNLVGAGAVAAAEFFSEGLATPVSATIFGAAKAATRILFITAGTGGGALAGASVGASGVGMLHDDGSQAHEFTVCRGWDITRTDYENIRAVFADYKRKSDQHELFWLITGKLGAGDPNLKSYVGNCTTMGEDVFAVLGITVVTVTDLTRPTAVGDSLAKLSRLEPNPNYANTMLFEHPWIYATKVPDPIVNINTLGSWPAPSVAGAPAPPQAGH